MLRGEELKGYNIIEFFVNTYKDNMECCYLEENEEESTKPVSDEHRGPGRRRNDRYLHLPNHPKFTKKLRIKQLQGHNQLPNFIGCFFPWSDDSNITDFYCTCMLLLLKPWQNPTTDLKSPKATWSEAFSQFLSSASKKSKDIIASIQYFYESHAAADEEQEKQDKENNIPAHLHHQTGDDARGSDCELDEDAEDGFFTEEGLTSLMASQTPLREELHGRHAVELAKYAKIFTGDLSLWQTDPNSTPISNATGDDLTKLIEWKKQLEASVNAQNSGFDSPQVQEALNPGDVRCLDMDTLDSDTGTVSEIMAEVAEVSITAVNPSQLKPDQFRAYNIITWHLDQTLAGNKPPPLRMIILGEGGTGKSKVIQTVTEYFIQKGAKSLLLKAAYTGVAASLIDGKTTHVIGFISTSGRPISDETKAKLQQFWKYFVYLVIDEISMISKTFLATLSCHIGIGKVGTGEAANSDSFGGINVIFCGNFHQFPPVACAASEALYQPQNMSADTVESQLGQAIYEEFTTVVILREQMRVTDGVWSDFLTHLHYGRVQKSHLDMLWKQIIRAPGCPETNFDTEPWNDTSLVTPRHAVRMQWNDTSVRKHCRDKKTKLFICTAEDHIGGRKLSLAERYAVAARNGIREGGKRRRKSNNLPAAVEIAVGMKVMVTSNVETDLDVTNGARGEIVDIILHPNEPTLEDGPVVKLKYLPSYVLVKLMHTRASRLEGLDEGIIPVEVATQNFQIKVRETNGKYITRSVRRRQYPMTAAYGFTDYRSQGQTLPYVIVDIAKPPSGGLDLFNLYVALSRSSGRETIRLLRDFDDQMFLKTHDVALLAEDDQMETR